MVVFFPTEKDTRFCFLIQGPYRTTPSRDNIPKENDWNVRLVEETAFLISGVLPILKEMGLLNVSLLEALPIRLDDFQEGGMFHPIVVSVRRTLSEQPLLPAENGGFTSAKEAKLARGVDLRRLLSDGQLTRLFGSDVPLNWISGEITQDRTPDLRKYLMEELNIEEITPDSFARKVTKEFLAEQTDDWIAQFYSFLSGQEALWRAGRYSSEQAGPIRDKQFIRLENGEHVKPFDNDGHPNAYLPPEDETNFPTVKRRILDNEEALNFLKKLKIREIGEREEIESILSSYYGKDTPDPSIDRHLKHIKRFIRWHNNQSSLDLFEGYFIFLDVEKKNYCTPDSFYIDTPFEETGLSELFDQNDEGESKKIPLWEEYSKIKGFKGLAISLGVMNGLEIEESDTWEHPARSELHKDYGRLTHTRIDEDYKIDHLADILEMKKVGVSKLVWKTMCKADPTVLKARYRPNQQYSVRTAPSSIVLELRGHEWIPNIKGEFCKPVELTEESLIEDLVLDYRNGWLSAIGFGENAEKLSEAYEEKVKYAQALGIKDMESIEILKELEDDPELLTEVKSLIEAKKAKPEFPTRKSRYPDRRERKVLEDLDKAREKSYEQKKKRVRTSRDSIDPNTWLRSQYTNDDGQMVCQICKKEMPFKKRDGQYYFEAVEISADIPIEYEEQFIALCPLCAAMYKEFIKRDDNAMKKFKEVLTDCDDLDIPISLGDLKTSVRFVAIHFNDLKTILQKMT